MYSVIPQFSKQGFFLTKGKLLKSIQPFKKKKKETTHQKTQKTNTPWK